MSAAVVLLVQSAQLAGYAVSDSDQAALVAMLDSGFTVATTIVSIIAALCGIWGRVRAQRPITSVLPQAKA